MTNSDKDFVVAVELGSSKISGIAGKKKDGTMQILAYAEEKTAGCVKRGVVYNIEKTYQSINTIISKLEAVLKTKITRAYVGLGGQSVRSYKCMIRRNLLTQSYITNEAIDAIRQESYEIPFNDYEVLENYPQEYVVDSSVIADPVGVMGTNIEGEFLDVIAKNNLRANIDTVFANAGVDIVEGLISPLQLANNVLTDAEKRSGCALVDLGADTTTLVVYKNNIVRYLVTIPLGCNNINKDLSTLPIDDAETEDVKLKYGDACQEFESSEESEPQYYTTSDGRQIDVATIRNVIEARMGEIIANVSNQIVNSDYSGKLLAGLVITGGGSSMKNIVKAFTKSTKIDKVRIATKVNQMVVKTSNASNISLESAGTTTIVSLLLAGTVPCGGEDIGRAPDMFDQQMKEEERRKRAEEAEAAAKAEEQDATAFDAIKSEIRSAIDKVKKQDDEVKKYGSDKKVRQRAKDLSLTILDATIGEKYEKAFKALEGKDKFKQSLREGAELAEILKRTVDELTDHVNSATKENSAWGRFKRTLTDLVSDDDNN
ncbi:MAG: cell division protein FtsA [Bacteroidaceae bacterium]|nr:cell division protein FtsA [Bacteroidaceae bacterium]MDD6016468.1 cell division protein FtsA [Prevotellaceae bacterium]MDD7526875.1 cell division protein FtsA [Prevotellaceae bacterium]MDY5761169.1 cell division protein FtsA [Bacteroidaceae bacterium]